MERRAPHPSRRARATGSPPYYSSRGPNPLPNLPRVMPSMDPVEPAPLAGRQRSEKRVIHNFRPGAEPPLAIVQDRVHLLKLRREGLLNLQKMDSILDDCER